MGNVYKLVLYLIDPADPDSREHQEEFYDDPMGVCSGKGLTQEETALIFTMNEKKIAKRTKQEGHDLTDMIDEYLGGMLSNWPPVGLPEPDPWSDPGTCQQGRPTPAVTMRYGAGPFKPMWARPWPHIDHLFTRRAHPGETIDFILAGEGLMPGATIELLHYSGNPPPIVYKAEANSNGYHCCNFRRAYLRIPRFTIPANAQIGEYSTRVINPGTQWRIEGGAAALFYVDGR